MISSGSAHSNRPPPLRPTLPARGPVRSPLTGRSALRSDDGGWLELSEFFGGTAPQAPRCAPAEPRPDASAPEHARPRATNSGSGNPSPLRSGCSSRGAASCPHQPSKLPSVQPVAATFLARKPFPDSPLKTTGVEQLRIPRIWIFREVLQLNIFRINA